MLLMLLLTPTLAADSLARAVPHNPAADSLARAVPMARQQTPLQGLCLTAPKLSSMRGCLQSAAQT